MLSSLVRWKTSAKWYIIALALPCGVFWISLGIVLLCFPTPHIQPPASEFLKIFFLTLPFGPLWEELAWRAYTLRKLQARYSRLASALILGVYWAVWHIPLWLVTLNLNANTRVPVLLLISINLIA